MTQVPDTLGSALPPYQVVGGDPVQDREHVLQVWRDCGIATMSGQDAARYEWFYLQNPADKAQVNFLTTANAEQRIGFLGVGARLFYIDGESHKAGVLVDFMVEPRHRTAMPALLIQRGGQTRALQSMALLYGIPDTKAVAIMNRLGSHVRFELPFYARVMRFRPYLLRHMPTWCATPLAWCVDNADQLITRLRLVTANVVGEWLEAFDARFDRLWDAVPKKNLCIGVRNREFLQWRFCDQPGKRFRIFAVRPRGSGELCSYFVCEFLQGMLVVKDCLHVGSSRQLRYGLLLLCAVARASGANVVNLQVTPMGDFPSALRATFFRQRSKRLFVANANQSIREPCATLQWYVTPADEDV